MHNFLEKLPPDLLTTELLTRKHRLEHAISCVKQELFHLNTTLNYLQKNQIDAVYKSISTNHQQHVTPITLPDKNYAENWQALEYPHKTFIENAPNLFTAKGESVRSKSEVIIADTLFRLGIPYRYEFPVKLQKYTVHPDFYCLNLRTRKEYAWERLGMMDIEEYATSAVEKMSAYENDLSVQAMKTRRKILFARILQSCRQKTGVKKKAALECV